MDNVLEVKNLNKKFAGFSIDHVSFNLPAGFIMGFIGPNGAGKTTTIKLILNMLANDGGAIQIFGKDHIADEQEIKERIGVVMDKPFYVEDWTLSAVGKALSPFYQRWDSHQYSALLSKFALDPKKKVKELSRGMQMKLMVAAALSHGAEFLILDEPTSVLAPEQKRQVIGYREHGVGFDGLVDSAAIASFPRSIVAEPSNLDEMVVRFNMNRGGQKA